MSRHYSVFRKSNKKSTHLRAAHPYLSPSCLPSLPFLFPSPAPALIPTSHAWSHSGLPPLFLLLPTVCLVSHRAACLLAHSPLPLPALPPFVLPPLCLPYVPSLASIISDLGLRDPRCHHLQFAKLSLRVREAIYSWNPLPHCNFTPVEDLELMVQRL